jgi:hypothetical protein
VAVNDFRFRLVNTINLLALARVQTPRLLQLHDRFTPEKSSAHSAAVLCSRLTFYCSAQCPGSAKSWRKVWAGLIQKLHRFIFQNFFEIEHFGCFISNFVIPKSHGKPHGMAVEERTAHKCARVLSSSPNLPSATKNCSRHSKQSI